MNISLIGPSGAGKGTHAEALKTRFNLLHLSTGDLFRENLENKTALGILARNYMHHGELVPDEIVDAMIEERIRKAPAEQGILFDGFPRTTYQAKFLDDLFRELGRTLDGIIYLRVSDEEIVRRLSNRVICHLCQAPFHRLNNPFQSCPHQRCDGDQLYQREDDNPEMIRQRLKIFHRVTGPLVECYQPSGKLVIVEGEGEIQAVRSALVDAATAIQRRETRPATRAETAQIQALKPSASFVATRREAGPALDLVLLGAPGSGKGTQAEHLCRAFSLEHIATGDLFRENLKKQTELGKLAKGYMDRGELVPDHVTEAMVRDRLGKLNQGQGFILDGFPRTLSQAEALTEIMTQMQQRLSGVLYIKVSDEQILARLSGRYICRSCQAPFHLLFKPPVRPGMCDACGGQLYQRPDDNPETVRNRLKTFHRQTEPVADYFRQAGLLVELDGEGELQVVTHRVVAAGESLLQRA